jgi:low affinity Fe/Cu permease
MPDPGKPDKTPTMSPGERAAQTATRWAGSTVAASVAMLFIVIWFATGPAFHWSDTWQLVMNTTSSIVTFLMVFLIQRSQNKDTLAVHLKLNELLAAVEGASKRIVNVEDLSEAELLSLKERYQRWVDTVAAEHAARGAA